MWVVVLVSRAKVLQALCKDRQGNYIRVSVEEGLASKDCV